MAGLIPLSVQEPLQHSVPVPPAPAPGSWLGNWRMGQLAGLPLFPAQCIFKAPKGKPWEPQKWQEALCRANPGGASEVLGPQPQSREQPRVARSESWITGWGSSHGYTDGGGDFRSTVRDPLKLLARQLVDSFALVRGRGNAAGSRQLPDSTGAPSQIGAPCILRSASQEGILTPAVHCG